MEKRNLEKEGINERKELEKGKKMGEALETDS